MWRFQKMFVPRYTCLALPFPIDFLITLRRLCVCLLKLPKEQEEQCLWYSCEHPLKAAMFRTVIRERTAVESLTVHFALCPTVTIFAQLASCYLWKLSASVSVSFCFVTAGFIKLSEEG